MKLSKLALGMSFGFAILVPALAGPLNEPRVLASPPTVEAVQFLPRSGFRSPNVNGVAVDWCSTYANNCGAGGATLFCRQHGFARAISWNTFHPGRTFVLGSG